MHRKRFFEVAGAFVAFAIPALVALAPPSSTAAVTVGVRRTIVVKPSADLGTRLFAVPLGPRASDLGTQEGAQAARILPASFDVNADGREIDVLDTANARVVTFGFDGHRRRATGIVTWSRTVGDLLRLPDGTRYMLDVTRDELIKWSASKQTVVEHAGVKDKAVNARLVADGVGVKVREPDLHVSVERTSVLDDGVRLEFGRPVYDVAESVTDASGVAWLLVDVDDGVGGAATDLVSIDLRHPGRINTRTIDAGIFGDVTRRIVPLGPRGVVVMSGTRSQLVFTKYGEQ